MGALSEIIMQNCWHSRGIHQRAAAGSLLLFAIGSKLDHGSRSETYRSLEAMRIKGKSSGLQRLENRLVSASLASRSKEQNLFPSMFTAERTLWWPYTLVASCIRRDLSP